LRAASPSIAQELAREVLTSYACPAVKSPVMDVPGEMPRRPLETVQSCAPAQVAEVAAMRAKSSHAPKSGDADGWKKEGRKEKEGMKEEKSELKY
jgi:hypothetical protein